MTYIGKKRDQVVAVVAMDRWQLFHAIDELASHACWFEVCADPDWDVFHMKIEIRHVKYVSGIVIVGRDVDAQLRLIESREINAHRGRTGE